MRWISTLALLLITGSAAITTVPAHAAGEIQAVPTAVAPGQKVTLTWFFAGTKVTVSGGRFAPGTNITGRNTLTDTPKKTTTYVFDVYYHPKAAAQDQATAPGKLVHVRYNVTVEVMSGTMPAMTSYKGSHGWHISYQTGWTPMTNEGQSDDLVYFQQEEDAIDRVAVAIVGVKDKTASQLMDDVRADIPSHYTNYQLVSQADVTHQGLPAVIATFIGNDQSHPGTRTESEMLVFINGDRGFVISARTTADRFSKRLPILDKMVQSFTLTGKIYPVVPATNADSASTAASDKAAGSASDKTIQGDKLPPGANNKPAADKPMPTSGQPSPNKQADADSKPALDKAETPATPAPPAPSTDKSGGALLPGNSDQAGQAGKNQNSLLSILKLLIFD